MNMDVKALPCCSQCGSSHKPSELNGSFLKDGSWDYSKAYCSRLAQCDSKEANSQIDDLLENLSIDSEKVSPPIPQQAELLPVSSSVALLEYKQSFKNESVHLPEVAFRYLIWLISSDSSIDDIKLFANQMRIEMNKQRLDRLSKAVSRHIEASFL